MDHLFEVIANLIIDGLYTFKQVLAKFKAGVAKKLKEKGREDLATPASKKKEDKH